jgi:hypothetical protein
MDRRWTFSGASTTNQRSGERGDSMGTDKLPSGSMLTSSPHVASSIAASSVTKSVTDRSQRHSLDVDSVLHSAHVFAMRDVVDRIMPSLKIRTNRKVFRSYDNTVPGAEIVMALIHCNIARDQFEALSLGNDLIAAGLMCNAKDPRQPFKNKTTSLYRFYMHGGAGPHGTIVVTPEMRGLGSGTNPRHDLTPVKTVARPRDSLTSVLSQSSLYSQSSVQTPETGSVASSPPTPRADPFQRDSRELRARFSTQIVSSEATERTAAASGLPLPTISEYEQQQPRPALSAVAERPSAVTAPSSRRSSISESQLEASIRTPLAPPRHEQALAAHIPTPERTVSTSGSTGATPVLPEGGGGTAVSSRGHSPPPTAPTRDVPPTAPVTTMQHEDIQRVVAAVMSNLHINAPAPVLPSSTEPIGYSGSSFVDAMALRKVNHMDAAPTPADAAATAPPNALALLAGVLAAIVTFSVLQLMLSEAGKGSGPAVMSLLAVCVTCFILLRSQRLI